MEIHAEDKRLDTHKRNEKLEEILGEVNALLGRADAGAISSFRQPKYPVVLVMGSPRSGTTLLLQFLAASGYFCYPTNILSRFYCAPRLGAKIQLMLTTYDFKNEIFGSAGGVDFVSTLGKTRGALAPHEFWYFWRRFFRPTETHKLSEEQIRSVDHKQFAAELAALEAVFDKPLVMKGMVVNWDIPFVSRILEKVLFIHIRRHPLYNIQSILGARKDYSGDVSEWWSFRPPEYPKLKGLGPYEQVAGQVYFTNGGVEEGLAAVNRERALTVEYEELCAAPREVFRRVAEKLSLQGLAADWPYVGPESFPVVNDGFLADEEQQKVISAYAGFSGETLSFE